MFHYGINSVLILYPHVCSAHKLAAGDEPFDARSRRAPQKRQAIIGFDRVESHRVRACLSGARNSRGACDPRALNYRPESKGLLEAREAVAEYYAGRAGFSAPPSAASVDPERILLASGTSEAYTHIFRLLCETGDEILVPAPSYPLFEFLADLADIRLVPYPLLYDHGWQIDFNSLRAALTPRSRAVLIVHPNNPTGSFVKPREAAELAEICAAREMAIVADEVFLDYCKRRRAGTYFRISEYGAHIHAQRPFQNFPAPANETCLDCGERPGRHRTNGRRPPRNHRRYFSFTEHAGATCLANVPLASSTTCRRNCSGEFPQICPPWMKCCANRNHSRASIMKAAGTPSCASRSPQRTTTSPSLSSNATLCWSTPAIFSIFRAKVFWYSA